MFMGLFLGGLVYLLTFSKYFIKINVFILSTLKFLIYKILKLLFYPIKCILNFCRIHLNKPFMLLIINIKELKNLLIYKKREKKKKISSERKDFSI